VGIAAVTALVVYLVAASDDPRGNEFSGAAKAEADSNPDIPGQFIDLQKIYGGVYGAAEGPTTAAHVSGDVDYAAACVAAEEPTAGPTGEATSSASPTTGVTATEPPAGAPTATAGPQVCNSNPPVGGPHWSGACGTSPADSPANCGPAGWGYYREPWDAETLVHNMEHGGVVIWYNTDDQNAISELEQMAEDRVEDKDIIVMAPYPGMEEDTIAVTSWSRIDKFPISEYTPERVEDFINRNLCRFNPEDLPGC
jgi:hypothetical protein